MEEHMLNPDELSALRENIAKANLLKCKLEEVLANPFLGSEPRKKYKSALAKVEKFIRATKHKMTAAKLFGNLDPDNTNIPRHYQDRKRN
jgi:hypothetical protein